MSESDSRISYLAIIRSLRFSAPPRALSMVLFIAFFALAIYDLFSYHDILEDGTPLTAIYLVTPFYLLTSIFLVIKSPLSIFTTWIMLVGMHFNLYNDEMWFIAAVLCTAFTIYAMSAWFWIPSAGFFLYYYIFGLWRDNGDSTAISLYVVASAGAFTLYILLPIFLRLQVEKMALERELYEAKLASARRRTEEERKSLARELHDVVAHELTIIAMQSRMAKGLAQEEKDEVFQLIGDQSRGALAELRRLLAVMRLDNSNSMLEPENSAMSIDLRQLAFKQREQLENLNFTVDVKNEGNLDHVPMGLRPTVSRIINESVTNIVKHGRANTEIKVDLKVTPDQLEYTLINQIGKNTLPTSGFGLKGLEERIKPLGGTLISKPVKDRWFFQLKLPY